MVLAMQSGNNKRRNRKDTGHQGLDGLGESGIAVGRSCHCSGEGGQDLARQLAFLALLSWREKREEERSEFEGGPSS